MGWGRDVIAPLLIAYSAAITSSALALTLGGQRLLHLQPSSYSTTHSHRGAENERCVHCSLFSSSSSSLFRSTTATRRRCHSQPSIDANYDVEKPTASIASSGSSSSTADTETTAADATAVASPQTTRYTIDVGVHPDVASVAVKHAYQLPRFLEHYPISTHTKQAYDRATEFVRDFHLSRSKELDKSSSEEGSGPKEDEESEGTGASGVAAREMTGQPFSSAQRRQQFRVVLDSGCGTGRSSVLLAESYPHLPVLGVDRSAVRLSKGSGSGERRNNDAREERKIERDGANERRFLRDDADSYEYGGDGSRAGSGSTDGAPANLLLLRADLVDLWILASRDDAWAVEEHAILYPNPYPKRSQLRGRWHGHPVFPVLLGLGGRITLRSNWKTYLEEVCDAVLAINDAAMSTDYSGGIVVRRRESNSSNSNRGNDILEPVATAAASYAASARARPMVFSPVTPATNFEAKYMAVGETVYELRLEPGVVEH